MPVPLPLSPNDAPLTRSTSPTTFSTRHQTRPTAPSTANVGDAITTAGLVPRMSTLPLRRPCCRPVPAFCRTFACHLTCMPFLPDTPHTVPVATLPGECPNPSRPLTHPSQP